MKSPTVEGKKTLAALISAIANRSEAKVKGATVPGDRSNRRPLRGYSE
ncbi:MAG: hypothetical protein ACREUE_08915 [Panacagrimonas sp.]